MKSKKSLLHYRIFVFALILFTFWQCKTQYHIDAIDYPKNQSINNEISDDAYVDSFIQPYKKQIDANLQTIIATTAVDLTKEGLSSNLGNLLADAVLQAANQYSQKHHYPKVDFALLNHGGMRINIGKGDVTLNTMYELMPFENTMTLVTLSGKDLEGMIEYMIESKKGHPIAGISLEYENGKVKQALIQGKPIQPNQKYVVATNNYLYEGGDDMDFFQPNIQVIETPLKIRDIFITDFTQRKILPNSTEQRLIIK